MSVATKLKKFHTVLQECGGVKLGLQVCMLEVARLHTIKADNTACKITAEPSHAPCMPCSMIMPDGQQCSKSSAKSLNPSLELLRHCKKPLRGHA